MDIGARGTVNSRDNLATYREYLKELDRKRQEAFDRMERNDDVELELPDVPRVTSAERHQAIGIATTLGFEV